MAVGSILQLAAFSSTPSPPPTGYLEMYVQGTTIYLQDPSGNVYAFGTTTGISQLTGDVSAIGPGSATSTVNFVGGQSALNIANTTSSVLNATSVGTPSTLVIRDSSGNFSANVITASLTGNVTGNVSGSSATFTGSLSGDVTGTQNATSISSGIVIGKLLSGYIVGSNTPLSATDSILGAFEKLQGQINAIGGADVTAVTATSPLFSSGGSAPNITIQQATTSENGYISSADWNTFNGKQNALTIGNLTDTGTDGITVTGGTGAIIGSGTTISQHTATSTSNGYLTSTDWNTFNGKQNALTFGNLTGSGFVVTGGTDAIIGSGSSIAMVVTNDLWVARYGNDVAGAGTINNPFLTVGYALTQVSSPSSLNTWIIHISGRCDAETGNILIPPYVFLVGTGGGDVAAYLRLPTNNYVGLGAGWTSNGRSGIQNLYLGGGTSVNLDFSGYGGSAGSSFIFDNVSITGTLNHTGRGINGGDYLTTSNGTTVFGNTTLSSDEGQFNNTIFAGTVTIETTESIAADISFVGGNVQGALLFTQIGAAEASIQSSNVSYDSTFTTVGTITATLDDSLPPGYVLSAGTTRVNSKNASSLAYVPATPSNWTSVPALVNTALDELATSTHSINGSAITSLNGDVVATGPGVAASTIQSNVVTNSKLAQAPANTIKGNNTGSTANEVDLTTSQVSTMLSPYFDISGAAATVQTNLNNYINPTSLQFSWLYQNPHYYTQMIYTGSNVTEIIYWDSPSMITQLFTKNMTYTGGLVTSVVLTRISDSSTLTKTIAYSGSQVSNVIRS